MALTIVLLLLIFGKGLDGQTFSTKETKLRETLFKKYDKDVRPNDKTEITISSIIVKDLRYDEKSNVLEIFAYMTLEWTDERLAWNETESEEDNLSLKIPSKKIWLPDLAVYNSATSEDVWRSEDTMVVVYPDGKMLLVSPTTFRVICISDLTHWPRDTQTCFVKFGSWSHDGYQLDLITMDITISDEERSVLKLTDGSQIHATQWNITDIGVKRNEKFYTCCPEPYIDIDISVNISRNAPGFAAMIQVPTICLSLMTMVVFLLPPSAGEKVTFGGLCLILNMILMAYTSNIIGQSPTQTPLIVGLLYTHLRLLVLNVVVSAIVIRIAAEPNPYQIPKPILEGLRIVSYCLCLFNYSKTDPEEESRSRSTKDTSKDTDQPATSSMYPTLSDKSSYPEIGLQPMGTESSNPCDQNRPGYSPVPTAPIDVIDPRSEDPKVIQSGPSVLEYPQSHDILPRQRSHSHEWLLVAAIVDRFFFFLYFTACIGTFWR